MSARKPRSHLYAYERELLLERGLTQPTHMVFVHGFMLPSQTLSQMCCTWSNFPKCSCLFAISPSCKARTLLATSGARVLVSGHDHGPSVDSVEGFGGDGRAVGTDGSTDGHEEAAMVSPNSQSIATRRTRKLLRIPSCIVPGYVAFHWVLGRSAQCW